MRSEIAVKKKPNHSQVQGAVTQEDELAQLRGQQGGGKYNRKT